MKGNEFIGHQPSNQRWSADGKTIYFEWNPNNEIGDKTYYWQKGFSQPKLVPKEAFNFSNIQYQGQEKFDVVYYTNQGTIFSYHKKTKENKIIYQTTSNITRWTDFSSIAQAASVSVLASQGRELLTEL